MNLSILNTIHFLILYRLCYFDLLSAQCVLPSDFTVLYYTAKSIELHFKAYNVIHTKYYL